MKKHANKTKHSYRNQIKKSKKSKQSKQSKQSKRATNKPTRNSKTIKNTALSKKQRALKQLKCAIKTHILKIIRAHKTKRKHAIFAGGDAGGQNSHNAIVGGGKYGADPMVMYINNFFKWLYTMITSMFTGFNKKPRENAAGNNNSASNNNTEIPIASHVGRSSVPEEPSEILKQINLAANVANKDEIARVVKQAKEDVLAGFPFGKSKDAASNNEVHARKFFQNVLNNTGYKALPSS